MLMGMELFWENIVRLKLSSDGFSFLLISCMCFLDFVETYEI